MFCPTCGQPVQGAERYCNYCGGALGSAAPSPAPVAPPAPTTAPEVAAVPASSEPRGVGGWLVVFCVWLTILAPLMELRAVPYLRYGSLNWILFVSLSVTVFGVMAGIWLWQVKPKALVYLRIYFGLVFATMLLGIIAFLVATRGEMLGGPWIVIGWLRTLVFLGVWIAYFRVSQRVRNTYGANL
jgi:hypothetical protein